MKTFISMTGIVLSLLGVAVSSSECIAAPWDTEQGVSHLFLLQGLPEGCHAEQRRVAALGDKATALQVAKLSATLTKIDVVCVGDEVTIDRPIKTNGGDVLVYASKVVIAQPIDTRPYFPRPVQSFFVQRADVPNPEYDDAIDRMLQTSQYFGLRQLGGALFDYYQRCTDCIQYGGLPYAAELLGGMTPLEDGELRKFELGIAPSASDFDPVAVKSGEILVLATSVELAEQQTAPTEHPSPLDCKPAVARSEYLLNVSGARGARGGFGNDLRSSPNPPAINTPGGPGADAGVVRVVTSAPLAPDVRNHLDLTTTVKGGPGGANEKVHTVPFKVFTPPGAGRPPIACSLDYRPDAWPQAARGRDGDFQVLVEKPDSLAMRAATFVRSHDALNYYDLDELARRAKLNRSIASLSFTDYLESQLDTLLARAQFALTADMLLVMLPTVTTTVSTQKQKTAVSQDSYVPQLFTTQQPPSAVVYGPSLSTSFQRLTLYAAVDANAANRVREFFRRSGGLLNSPTGDYVDSSENQQLIELLSKSIENENKIAAGVNGLQLEVQALRVFLQQSAMESRLDALRSQLDAAERAARLGGLAPLADALKQVAGQAKTARGSYKDFRDAMGGGSDTKKVLSGIEFYANLGVLAAGLADLWHLDSGPTPADVRKQIELLQAELAAFIADSQRERDELNAQGAAILRDLLSARRQHSRQLLLRTVSFEYLLRRILILYQLDVARRRDVLQLNLTQLLSYADGDVARLTPAGQLRATCAALPRAPRRYEVRNNCLYWPTTARQQIFWGEIARRAHPELGEVPLITVAPNVDGKFGRPLLSFAVDSQT